MTFCFLSLSGGEGVWHFCFPSLSLGDFCCLSCVLLGLRLTKDLLLFGYEKQMLEWDPPPRPFSGASGTCCCYRFPLSGFCLFLFGAGGSAPGMWGLSSSTRDQTHASCMGVVEFNPWTTRAVPVCSFTGFNLFI